MTNTRSAHLIALLAALSHQTGFSVGCYCADQARCHTRGRLVSTVFAGDLSDGGQSFVWDGRDNSGVAVPAGIYFAHLVGSAGGSSAVSGSAKIVLLR